MAEAYETATKLTTFRFLLEMVADYIPFVRKLPIEENKGFERASEVINRVSKELVEEKYRKAENDKLNEKDLLSLLININKSLPTEERMTDDELKYQVIKINYLCYPKIIIHIYCIFYTLGYDIFTSGA